MSDVPKAGWRGGICLDEMQIQDDVQIAKSGKSWDLVGFVDIGNTVGKAVMATHVLHFVFHGFTGFRWPVAFYGTHTATAHQIYLSFLEVLETLILYGFQVDNVSMDGASTNRSFTRMLFDKSPSDYHFKAVNVVVQERKLVVL